MAESLLRLDDVTMHFGGVVALDDVSFSIEPGQIFGLIGPNGAGKTTCFNAITGVYQPTSGLIRFDGTTLNGHKRYDITRRGVARTFQNIRLFPEMSALENVMVGLDAHHRSGVGSALLHLPRHKAEEEHGRARAIGTTPVHGHRRSSRRGGPQPSLRISTEAGDRACSRHLAEAVVPR